MAEPHELTLPELAATGLSPAQAKALFRSFHQGLEFPSPLTAVKNERAPGVIKTDFRLPDGLAIEAVFMDWGKEKKFVCVSSQAGCPVGCRFCATGRMGLKRNLTAGEIIAQVYHFAKTEKITNLVFMGMGEPFLNYDRVTKAVRLLNSELGQNIALRKIVISTVGIVTGLEKFGRELRALKLAWSLAAPEEKLRRSLIPYSALPTIDETIAAIIGYQKRSKQRITIEYVLLKGVNDSAKELEKLFEISRKIDSHINLIEYNPTGKEFTAGDVDAARTYLKKLKANVTIRRSLGKEISAACGQLLPSHVVS
ncbi:MAG: 23S rRNA (adenine(2503)-C(2))-methyltransferase RlmN [Candidatus Saganbacteria bacterium]|nr:23S rRNA (adenine(2503)-C(2))-methyltransferase RlmN [Candidatus Saganbacteria bacterium]